MCVINESLTAEASAHIAFMNSNIRSPLNTLFDIIVSGFLNDFVTPTPTLLTFSRSHVLTFSRSSVVSSFYE